MRSETSREVRNGRPPFRPAAGEPEPPDPGQDLTIGQRVARSRKAKGMSQEVLAHLLGRSPSWVTKVERGERRLDRMSVILEIARVLKVDVTQITGQPIATGGVPPADAAVAAIRRVLIGSGAGGLDGAGDAEVDTLPVLRARMREANRRRHDADYEGLGSILPSLLEDLQLAAATLTGSDRESAQTLIVDACHCSRMMLKSLGYYDLAWIAVERGREIARQLGDPLLLAASEWNRAEVYLATGAVAAALDFVLREIHELDHDGLAEAPPRVSLLGMLHLKAALGDGVLGREQQARIHLSEARRLAALLGGDRNDFGTLFGPTNAILHGVLVAMELGFPEEAVAVAAPLSNGGVDMAPERRVRLSLDLARAHAQLRREDQATRLLLESERAAPDYLHAHPATTCAPSPPGSGSDGDRTDRRGGPRPGFEPPRELVALAPNVGGYTVRLKAMGVLILRGRTPVAFGGDTWPS